LTCKTTEIILTNTDSAKNPPEFCYDATELECKTKADYLGCTSCESGKVLGTFTITHGFNGVWKSASMKKCVPGNFIYIPLLIIAAILLITVPIAIYCYKKNKNIYNQTTYPVNNQAVYN
jgi:hypothetical protein